MALSKLPSQDYFSLLSNSICFIDLTHEEFFLWARTRGFNIPEFWKPSVVKGELQPELAGKLATTETTSSRDGTKRRGKKKGAGSYEDLDAPLLREMESILKQGKAASAEEAARKVAEKAHGGGTAKSKAERLGRRFRKKAASKK
jgi:hypothetical protein